MMRYLAIILAFAASPVFAVSAVADLPDQTTTHCVFSMDGTWGADVPVVVMGGLRVCVLDVTGVTSGAHSALVKAVRNDAVWGRLESAPSSPLAFTKPSAPGTPSGFRLVP